MNTSAGQGGYGVVFASIASNNTDICSASSRRPKVVVKPRALEQRTYFTLGKCCRKSLVSPIFLWQNATFLRGKELQTSIRKCHQSPHRKTPVPDIFYPLLQYTYIYIHTYTYVYIYIYIHTHMYIYIYTYTYVYIYTHTQMYIYIYTHTHMYIYIYTYLEPILLYVLMMVSISATMCSWFVAPRGEPWQTPWIFRCDPAQTHQRHLWKIGFTTYGIYYFLETSIYIYDMYIYIYGIYYFLETSIYIHDMYIYIYMYIYAYIHLYVYIYIY